MRGAFRITVGETESDVRDKLEDGLKVLGHDSPVERSPSTQSHGAQGI